MKSLKNIEEKVAETMASLDGTTRAAANPFLYTRVLAALKAEEMSFWARTAGFMTRPVVAFATVIVIILMNSLIFFNNPDSRSNVISQDDDQVLSGEYTVSAFSEDNLYTLNDEQP